MGQHGLDHQVGASHIELVDVGKVFGCGFLDGFDVAGPGVVD